MSVVRLIVEKNNTSPQVLVVTKKTFLNKLGMFFKKIYHKLL